VSGEAAAIGCAVCWALSSTILRRATEDMPSILLNALRSLIATVLYLVLIVVSGQLAAYAGLTLHDLLFIGINLAFGIVIGDTAYYSAMRLIGVSRALTISSTYPLLAALLAGVVLDERFTYRTWLGFLLCIVGVIMVARAGVRSGDPAPASRARKGALLALASALMWAMGTVALRIGSLGLEATIVNSVRLGGVAIVAGSWSVARGEFRHFGKLGRRQLLPVVMAALIGSFVGATLYLTAVQKAGASKAAVLASTAPLFSVPMTRLAGEPVNGRLVAAMIVAVAGVMLVV